LSLALCLLGKARLFGFGFHPLLRFHLGGRTSFLGFACSALGFHLRGQCSSLAALDRGLVNSKVRPGAQPEDQDGSSGQQPGMNALALLGANRRELALVIEHSFVRLRGLSRFLFVSRFLFEADAQLRFVTLAQHPLFFFAASSLIGLSRFLFGAQSDRFLFLPLGCFGCDALALSRLALEPLLFFVTNTVFFDAHELAKIEPMSSRRLKRTEDSFSSDMMILILHFSVAYGQGLAPDLRHKNASNQSRGLSNGQFCLISNLTGSNRGDYSGMLNCDLIHSIFSR
jgi:hypothetical protein